MFIVLKLLLASQNKMLVLFSSFAVASSLLSIMRIEELREIADDSRVVLTLCGHGFPCLYKVGHIGVDLGHAVVDLLVDEFQSRDSAGYDFNRIVRLPFQSVNFLLLFPQNVM